LDTAVNPEGEDEVFVDMPSLESIQGWGENHLLSLGRHQKKVMNGTSGIADFAAEVFSTDVFSADVNQVLSKSDINNMPLHNNFTSLVGMENGEAVILLEEDREKSPNDSILFILIGFPWRLVRVCRS